MFLKLLVPCLLGLTVSNVLAQQTPVLPSQDSFYAAPNDFQLTAPGDVLRIRTAPGNLTATFGNASAVYDILFRTTDTNYQPSWAFTTVFVPRKVNSSALLSYQVPYNTPDVDAGPTTLLYGSKTDLGLIYSDIDTALSRGWWVNVPDHEGPLASFLCGVQEGHATLDSIRAVVAQFQGWSIKSNPKVALWGYSGGSLASGFAAELQVQYAPELHIAGAALGGIVANITSAIPDIFASKVFGGLIPAAVVGFSSQHPDVSEYILSQLNPSGQYNSSTFLSVKNMSIEQAFTFFANQPMDRYFRNGNESLNAPVLLDAFARDTVMGVHGVPQIPLYIYKAVHDELASVQASDRLVAQYCNARASVVYERNSIGGHLAEETNGDSRAIAWLASVLEGRYNHTGCTTRNVSINITDSAI